MSDPVKTLQILARAEMTLAEIRAKRVAHQSAILAVAVVVALIALVMLNIAALDALTAVFGPAVAALLVAVIDGVVAVALVAISQKAGPKPSEEKLAVEMRNMAHAELNADIDEVKADLTQVGDEVRKVRNAIVPFSGFSLSAFAPLLGILLKVFKKR